MATTEPTDESDETGEEDGETITLTVDVQIDKLHSDMLDDVCAATPTREAALDGLEEQLAEDLEAAGRVEQMIYNARQRVNQQRKQAADFLSVDADSGGE